MMQVSHETNPLSDNLRLIASDGRPDGNELCAIAADLETAWSGWELSATVSDAEFLDALAAAFVAYERSVMAKELGG